MTTAVAILDTTTYGVPSGNYDGSSQDWASDAVQAANYYRGRGGMQTFAIKLQQFEGQIILEATLDAVPETATWFEIYHYGDGSSVPLTDYHVTSIPGNFTWLRTRIEGFSGGTIESVTVTY